MLTTGRIARVGDTRPANQPFIVPVWAAVLPDDRDGAREGYPSNRLTGLHLFASAQYWGPHLGEDFVEEANDTTIGNDFLRAPGNMRTVDGDTGVAFGQVFAEAFLADPSRLSCGPTGCTILACAGDYVTVPYSIGNGALGFIDELCHSFYVTDAAGDDLSVLAGFYGRSSECGLRINASFQSSPGGFVTGAAQLKISEIAPTGTFRLYHEVDTCQSAVACESYGNLDARPYDNIVATDIFIRVESPDENPECPVNPLDEPLSTYCLTPLDPIPCASDSDCMDLGPGIAEAYEDQLDELWNPLIKDYLCLPAVAPNSFAFNPSFEETCQCPELPPEAIVP